MISEDLSEASVIFGVKQVPVDSLQSNKTFCFFSHTIKAQPDNMDLLDACLEKNVRLIDYEKLCDERGGREADGAIWQHWARGEEGGRGEGRKATRCSEQ